MRRYLLSLIPLLGFVGPLRAEHAKITLDVAGPQEKETAFMDQTPPLHGKNPRPVVHARVGDPIRIQYMFTNIYPNKTINDVVIHFFIAREEKVGQKDLPNLAAEDIVLETAFDMDFRPGGHAGARTTVKIDTPGVYLVRVESRNTQSDHEHFSAIDLVIEAN